MEDFMCVKLVERLLLHVGRVKELKLVTESPIVPGLQLFNQIKALHLNESLLQVDVHMVKICLKDQRV